MTCLNHTTQPLVSCIAHAHRYVCVYVRAHRYKRQSIIKIRMTVKNSVSVTILLPIWHCICVWACGRACIYAQDREREIGWWHKKHLRKLELISVSVQHHQHRGLHCSYSNDAADIAGLFRVWLGPCSHLVKHHIQFAIVVPCGHASKDVIIFETLHNGSIKLLNWGIICWGLFVFYCTVVDQFCL